MNKLARDLTFIAENRKHYEFYGVIKPKVHPNSLIESIESFIAVQKLLSEANIEYSTNANSISVCCHDKSVVEQIDGASVKWVENITEGFEAEELDDVASDGAATGFELSEDDWTTLLLIKSGDTQKLDELDVQWLEEAGLVTAISGTPSLTTLATEWINASKS